MRRAENGLIREPVRRSGVHAHQLIVRLHRGARRTCRSPATYVSRVTCADGRLRRRGDLQCESGAPVTGEGGFHADVANGSGA